MINDIEKKFACYEEKLNSITDGYTCDKCKDTGIWFEKNADGKNSVLNFVCSCGAKFNNQEETENAYKEKYGIVEEEKTIPDEKVLPHENTQE
jgi:hypothetical protein